MIAVGAPNPNSTRIEVRMRGENMRMDRRKKAMVEFRCAFCRGTGKDPFDLLSEHALCEVCGGSGKATVMEPARTCAFCRGSGVFPGSRLTCTVCMGRGLVTVEEPAEACPACGGAGVVAGHCLPCCGCGGKGALTGALAPALRPSKTKVLQRGKR